MQITINITKQHIWIIGAIITAATLLANTPISDAYSFGWHQAERIAPGTFGQDLGGGRFMFPGDIQMDRDIDVNSTVGVFSIIRFREYGNRELSIGHATNLNSVTINNNLDLEGDLDNRGYGSVYTQSAEVTTVGTADVSVPNKEYLENYVDEHLKGIYRLGMIGNARTSCAGTFTADNTGFSCDGPRIHHIRSASNSLVNARIASNEVSATAWCLSMGGSYDSHTTTFGTGDIGSFNSAEQKWSSSYATIMFGFTTSVSCEWI